MPRRKRSSGPSERRRKVRRRGEDNEEEEEDTALIISDSEHDEEEEDCPLKVTSRAARRQDREKTHMQDMTEDEMLDLALRLSEQEANSASRREQVEDADMRKAIAESLQVSSISETCSKRTRSAAKPHQDRDTVTAHVRCKLSFSNKLEKDGGSDEDVSEAQTSLPPMPDLSQKTSSQPSPPSPTIPRCLHKNPTLHFW
ncbi:hypothetical protein HF521_005791 [Silurus meridionalis]|uniref:BRCA1-A complex subunit RAP80 n=1 Tax=Silurus meridionalis TaxID=175797 RepID=A0A8T0AYT3_SILME|nr:hypothetical protein HF521_005791 [Silurus meridionalis]